MSTSASVLSPTRRSDEVRQFESALRARIVGQDNGVQALVEIYQVMRAGLSMPGRPMGSLLFLGPTGTGKTRVVEAAAEILFGDRRSLIKVDCAEFQHSHEIAKLIGSPPGYAGHRETSPVLTQAALEEFHTERDKFSYVLFDEIEKASEALWQLLLGMLDKATLSLGDNRVVDLSRTVIILTSNLGATAITGLMTASYGFAPGGANPPSALYDKVERTASEAARRTFSPEFLNRLDKVVVFHPLDREQMGKILELELRQVQQRALQASKAPFTFQLRRGAREFLLFEGMDARYGARHLKRAVERHLVCPLANLLATRQIKSGDSICVDWDRRLGHLVFWKEGQVSELTSRKESQDLQTGAEKGQTIQFPTAPSPNTRCSH